MADVRRLAWDAGEPPSVRGVESLIRSEDMDPVTWSNGPGDRYAAHAHSYDKVLYCATGSITFAVGDPAREFELLAGDGLVLPAGTTHSAVVGQRGCTCVEGHRPQ